MSNTIQIKRRTSAPGNQAGAPTNLAVAELAFNEVDNTLYIGRTTGGTTPVTVEALAGAGAFLALSGTQTASGNYTFNTGTVTLNGTVSGTGINSYVTGKRLNEFTAPNAAVSFGSQQITNLAAPTADAHAATKKYVDDTVLASQPTGVAYLADDNVFTGTSNTFQGTVSVDDFSVNGTTTAINGNGTANFADSVSVGGTLNVAVDLFVGGSSITLGGDGQAAFGSHVSIGGNLTASGAFTAADAFAVDASGNLTTLGSASIASDTFVINSDGSFYAAQNSFNVASTGSFSAAAGNFSVGDGGEILTSGSFSAAVGAFQVDGSGNLSTNASASIASGNFVINSDGSLSAAAGNFTVDAFGSTYIAGTLIVGPNYFIVNNNDGSFSASNAAFVVDAAGNLSTLGAASISYGNFVINSDGSFSASGGSFSVGDSGDVVCVGALSAANDYFNVNPAGDLYTRGTLAAADNNFIVDNSGNVGISGILTAAGITASAGAFIVSEFNGSFSAAEYKFNVGFNGEISAADGTFSVDSAGNVSATSLSAAGGAFVVGATTGDIYSSGDFSSNGSLSAAGGNFSVDTSGNIYAFGGISAGASGFIVNPNGSFSACSNNFYVDPDGSVYAANLNFGIYGNGGFYAASTLFSVDVNGDVFGNVITCGRITAPDGSFNVDANGATIKGALVVSPIGGGGDVFSVDTATATVRVNGDEVATKPYVDAIKQGLDIKDSVRVATTANITLSGTQSIDGVSVVAGDRVLVKNQSTASQNGIYVVAAGAWSRAEDADTSEKVTAGLFVFVEEGTASADTSWVLVTNEPTTLGTTSLTFSQFSAAGQIYDGSGLVKVGNTISVGTASTNRIVVNPDNIDLATTGVTAGTYAGLTVDAYGRVTSATNNVFPGAAGTGAVVRVGANGQFAASATISDTNLPTVGTAGTYRSVTTDAYGRVTAGTNPTTLAGYGITDAQTLDATLTALAGVTTAANKLIYATGADAFTTTDFSSFARDLLDDANAGAVRTTLGIDSDDDVTFGTVSATRFNNVTITAPLTPATFTLAGGKTLTVSNTLTFTGTDASSVAFGAGGTVAYIGSNNAFTGANTFTNTTGQTFRQAATQDGIILRGRAGGTSTRAVTVETAALSANRTITLPDAAGTVLLDSTVCAAVADCTIDGGTF